MKWLIWFVTIEIAKKNKFQMKISEHLMRFLFCFLFMTCVAIEVFSYTFFGNRILTATHSLTNSTYSSKWYEMPTQYRKHVIIFMERIKRNSVLMAGKLFPLNLALFTTVNYCYNIFRWNRHVIIDIDSFRLWLSPIAYMLFENLQKYINSTVDSDNAIITWWIQLLKI